MLPAPRTRPAHAEAQPLPLARCASVMAVDLAQPSRPLRVPLAPDRVRASLRENNHFYDDSSHSAQPAPWPRHPSMPAEQRLLKRQKVVSSGAGLVYFCGSARHLLAGFLRPTELARTARACVALRDILQGFRPTEDAYVWELWPEHHKRHFYTKRQCLIHVHAMRKSPARSHQYPDWIVLRMFGSWPAKSGANVSSGGNEERGRGRALQVRGRALQVRRRSEE